MHLSSYEKMTWFRNTFLADQINEPLVICDLGSQDVNGTYRPIFSETAWRYIGLDLERGKNVDIVLRSPYVWRELGGSSVDVVISGQALEHVQYFWITMLEIARVLRPGGICCILAPSSGPEHRYPMDCWRFYPDGMSSLAAFAQLELIEVSTQWEERGYADGSDMWHDSMLICRKPHYGLWRSMKIAAKRFLQHWALTIGMR